MNMFLNEQEVFQMRLLVSRIYYSISIDSLRASPAASPKASPKGIWGAPDQKTVPVASPKAHFSPARPHRGRTGDAGHTKKRGGEWRGRLVSGTINFNLTVAYLATEVIGAQRRCSFRRGAAMRLVAPSSSCQR
jgi:hypothetical protein